MPKATPTRVPPAQPCAIPTIIEFLLDETGSMRQSLTIAGFNEFLDQQRQDVSGPCLLTLTKFDSARLHRTPYVDLDITMTPPLTETTYQPCGGTNLRDSIIARIGQCQARLAQWDVQPRVLFVCMTDGLDNASHQSINYTAKMVRACGLNGDGLRDGGWTMVYLGADQNAATIGHSLGFPAENTHSFASADITKAMQTLSVATSAYRAASQATPFFTASQGA